MDQCVPQPPATMACQMSKGGLVLRVPSSNVDVDHLVAIGGGVGAAQAVHVNPNCYKKKS